jgi:uncharacterized protein (TIGR02594 family)
MKKLYTVRPGDTLSGIAHGLGIALAEILRVNPQITNPNLIASGQQIILPDGSDRSALIVNMANANSVPGDPLWLSIALREENDGVHEFDPGSNPRIVEYLKSCDDLGAADQANDGTAWCAAFANWCLVSAGKQGTNSAWALNWRTWGQKDDAPGRGTIVAWKRIVRGEVRGHVAFLIRDEGDFLLVLGGNQSNRVCQQRYPRNGMMGSTEYRDPLFRKPA